MTATGSASSANLRVTPSDSQVCWSREELCVVVEADEPERLGLVQVDVGERERRSVAIIGMSGNAKKPMIHGERKTRPQRARRQASPRERGTACDGRAAAGRPPCGQLPPWSQMACSCDFISAISLSMSRPGVDCHLVRYVGQVERLVVGGHDVSKLGTSANGMPSLTTCQSMFGG